MYISVVPLVEEGMGISLKDSDSEILLGGVLIKEAGSE